ncbi:mycothiol synthase [Georgenia satyanarayanai]|uniref:Mycothiol acetyltransferase n=1 Tax=Georgenia satyanarayanai TaxID=860221 RepID=A0A2Y9ARJ5_9MICO|nr:mycothiol synthase [Georgenia satyanarayanai]PYF98445.1 mycothiol synthase [Georgenia satyanarayanai]SSA45117.1 mycothiol synthase [Georgenia satyanarayanai]
MGTGLTGPASADAVLRLAAAATDADGVAPLNEQSVLAVRHGTDGCRHHWLGEGEQLLAYAVVDAEGSGELCVHPAHRRRGLGRRLLDAVLDDVPSVALWAHGDLPGAQGLARAAGLRVTRELWQMARDLDPAADAPAVEELAGVEVRTFAVGQDEEAWVALNGTAFADHPEQGRLTVADLRQRQAEPWFDPSLLWLAHEPGRPDALLASMWVKPDGEDAEIYALGVAPQAQGRGLGGHLTALALAEMRRRGFRRTTLYVEGENTAAIRTYRRAGYDRSSLDVQYAR